MNEQRLFIGAPMRCAGWEVYADSPNTDVDFVGPLDRMQGVSDATYTILYATCLNRLNRSEALSALHEWRRVLVPGGVLLTACVDAKAAAIGLSATTSVEDHSFFTGHLAQRSSWTQELLSTHMQLAGFKRVRRMVKHGLFNDVSELVHNGVNLGLSLIADRPA